MNNLVAEMKRCGVRNDDLAELLNCDVATIRNRLSGKSKFSIDDAIKIRDTFFHGLRIEYLFASSVSGG